MDSSSIFSKQDSEVVINIDNNKPILVTGATGYVASHLIKILLERGHKVRGTVRSLSNRTKYEFLYSLVPEKNDNLTFIEADLSDKASWVPAVDGCDYIFHVASPTGHLSTNEAETVGPAVAGTMNVLEAAVEKKAKKVVLTSSCVAMIMGNLHKVITEEDWSDEAKCPPYPKSKLLAERAAWEFYEKNKDKIEMTVVNPFMIFGPVFTEHKHSSEALFAEIAKGIYPGIFPMKPAIVDVRDTAEGHYKAMFTKDTNGKRYSLVGATGSMEQIITCLKKEFEKYGYQINDKHVTAEDINASESAVAKGQLRMMGMEIKASNERSVKELGMRYRSVEETVIDQVYSLAKQGIIPDKIHQK